MAENQIVKKDANLSPSERFTNKVISAFGDSSKAFQFTEKEKALISGYFIECDKALKMQSIQWKEIDMDLLAQDLAVKSRLGLDMQMKNHLFPIPFKSKKTGKVTLNLITGFEGEKHKRLKFAEEKPVDMKVELIHENDEFIPHKTGDGDTYELNIKNPFNRGEIIGGIGYIQFEDSRKNKLIMMSVADILKRKPEYAKPEFWGKWKEKMYEKTIMKELCNHIPLDADKVREYRTFLDYEDKREVQLAKEQAEITIEENANNGDFIDVEIIEEETKPKSSKDKSTKKSQENAIDIDMSVLDDVPDFMK